MDVQKDSADEKNEKLLTDGIPAKMRAFLIAYAKTGRLLRACSIAKINFNTHYRRLNDNPAYREAFEETVQHAAQTLEDTAYSLALKGDGHLLLALLRRFRPNEYRDRASLDVSGTINLAQILEAEQRVVRMKERDAGHSAA